MGEWKEVELSELIDFGNGKKKPESEGDIPIYGGNGILGYSADFNYENETIIIGRVGAYCGSVYYENKPIWVSDNALAAKAINGNSTKFLYYFLKNANLNQHAGGSSHPLVTQTLLNSLEYDICIDKTEQKAIAEVLSSLDDKIDLLHRQNQTLEQMAETLFRQWFVEEADEDWAIRTLNDVLSVKGGTTPSTKNPDYWDGDIHWTSPRDITSLNSIYLFDTERKITEEGLRKISSGLLPKGTLLMSSRAPVGVLAFTEVPIAINQGYIAVLDNKGFTKEFLYLWLKTNIDYVQSYANGSTFLEISKTAFKSLEIQSPPTELRNEFQKLIIPNFEKIKSNQTQILTLTALRDTLLPKLMSGEVRIDTDE
ncbi:restriction endonuclease subunit S [Croceimicrobium sp.]|uniref:restriction endonuclease subunit S n=1 Tax=Croceimicrobium sp. TaxID=2828340 RepID=UPI003BAB5136